MTNKRSFLSYYRRFWRELFFSLQFSIVVGIITLSFVLGDEFYTKSHEGIRNNTSIWFFYIFIAAVYSLVPTHLGFTFLSFCTRLSHLRFAALAALVGLLMGGLAITIYFLSLGDVRSNIVWDYHLFIFPIGPYLLSVAYFIRRSLLLRERLLSAPKQNL